jgi:hypothetical protein
MSKPSSVGRLLRPRLKGLLSAVPFMRYAAVCKAVAAAERRAACARAVASLDAQSGRILSVVTTSGALAEIDVPLLLPLPDVPDTTDVCEDIADLT